MADPITDWVNTLRVMSLSREEGWQRGYDAAVDALFDHAISGVTDGKTKALAEIERRKRLAAPDYSAVRKVLDEAPGSLQVSRSTAAFYLAMSPKTFQRKLKESTDPLPSRGITMDELREWFANQMLSKHKGKVPNPNILRQGRGTINNRPYLVDASGVILADAEVCGIPPEDIAEALATGGGVVILTLQQACEQPWRDQAVRGPWAAGYLRLLRHQLVTAEARVAAADKTDHEKRTGPAMGPSRNGGRI